MGNEPATLGQLALAAALEGAEVIGSGVHAATPRHKTSFRDIVTDVDLATEQAIIEFIRGRRPDDAFLGEERGDRPGSSGIRWIVDPLDGSANFVRGRPDYAVVVAAERDRKLVAGAIVKPYSGEWIACDEEGVIGSRGRPSVSNTQRLEQALISIAVSTEEARRPMTFDLLELVLPEIQDFRRTGSTSCDLFATATGELDAYVGIDTNPWDIAAGSVLVQAAGGRFFQFPLVDGQTQRMAFLVGTPDVVKQLAPLVRSLPNVRATAARLRQSPSQSTPRAPRGATMPSSSRRLPRKPGQDR